MLKIAHKQRQSRNPLSLSHIVANRRSGTLKQTLAGIRTKYTASQRPTPRSKRHGILLSKRTSKRACGGLGIWAGRRSVARHFQHSTLRSLPCLLLIWWKLQFRLASPPISVLLKCREEEQGPRSEFTLAPLWGLSCSAMAFPLHGVNIPIYSLIQKTPKYQ